MFKTLFTKLKIIKIKNLQIFNLHYGFTLIELLIVISITIVIAATGFVMLNKYSGAQNVRLTLDEISSAATDVRNKSISQLNGSPWGMRFINSSAVQKYEVFKGTSYASGTVIGIYPLSRGIKFSNPFSSSTVDFAFSSIIGALSNSQVVSVINNKGDSIVGDIVFNKIGGILTRFETGVVGYWHFDEATSATAYDASGSGNDGTIYNSPAWQSVSSCKAGSCLSFDGTNDYVSASSSASLSPTSAITISLWIKFNSMPSGSLNEIVQKQGAYGLKINASTKKVIGYVWGGLENHYSATALTTGVWYHIVMTFDGLIHKIYINGILENSESDTRVIPTSSNPLRIAGRESASAGEYVNAIIDEVRIYNRALSASEILGQYNDLK